MTPQSKQELRKQIADVVFGHDGCSLGAVANITAVLDQLESLFAAYSNQREVEASLGRMLNLKRLKAKARLAVYREVEQNWDKPSFKSYILTLHDMDLKMLEDIARTAPQPLSPEQKGGQ